MSVRIHGRADHGWLFTEPEPRIRSAYDPSARPAPRERRPIVHRREEGVISGPALQRPKSPREATTASPRAEEGRSAGPVSSALRPRAATPADVDDELDAEAGSRAARLRVLRRLQGLSRAEVMARYPQLWPDSEAGHRKYKRDRKAIATTRPATTHSATVRRVAREAVADVFAGSSLRYLADEAVGRGVRRGGAR